MNKVFLKKIIAQNSKDLEIISACCAGSKINIKNNTAKIEGNTKFIGAELMSSDLRASVALVLAAVVSTGKSYINRIYHLDRGYEKIENKLKKIGVKIKRLK